jgi:hypothetical protein
MQLQFTNLSRAKRAAKALAGVVPRLQLSKAQEAVAFICGYDDWAQLRAATESPSTRPSGDDEDLSPEMLEKRRSFQAERARQFFHTTGEQARKMVDAIAPGARMRAAKTEGPVVGTSIYMPDLNMRFNPDYPVVFELLDDVVELELDFVQPTADNPTLTHLVREMRLTFRTGETLSLEGVYLWKFRDLVPPPFADENRGYLKENPYASEDCADTVQRLRMAHDLMFARQERGFVGDPPLSIRLDLVRGLVTTLLAPGLQLETCTALQGALSVLAKKQAADWQALVDERMKTYLANGYMSLELKPIGNGMFGNTYVPKAWEGNENLAFDEFLKKYSPQQRRASGCGGNRTFRELLSADILSEVPLDKVTASWFSTLKNEQPVLFQQVCADLGIGTRSSAVSVANALLKTKDSVAPQWCLTSAVFGAQEGKTLAEWEPCLSARKPRPLERRSTYGAPKGGAVNV